MAESFCYIEIPLSIKKYTWRNLFLANKVFIITKEYADNLKNKIDAFSRKVKTKKQIVLEFVSLYGLQKNTWSEGLIHNSISLESVVGEEEGLFTIKKQP
ncbi:MAG: hypothetical protein V4591_07900 [Bdellovibrionota bacterium]